MMNTSFAMSLFTHALCMLAGVLLVVSLDYSVNAQKIRIYERKLIFVESQAKSDARQANADIIAMKVHFMKEHDALEKRINTDVDGIVMLNRQLSEYKQKINDAEAEIKELRKTLHQSGEVSHVEPR